MKHAIINVKGKPLFTGEIKEQTPEIYLAIKKEAENNLDRFLGEIDLIVDKIKALEEENEKLKIRLDRLEGKE